MSFKDKVKEAAVYSDRAAISGVKFFCIIVWFIPGCMLGGVICRLFGVRDAFFNILFSMLFYALTTWGFVQLLTRRRIRNSNKIMEKKICSDFPKGTTADEVFAMVDGMEDMKIPGNNGMLRCNSEMIAYVIKTGAVYNYDVIPVDKIKSIYIKHRVVKINYDSGTVVVANSSQAAWDYFCEIIQRTGRTDQLTPRSVICTALSVAQERLIEQQMVQFTGIKMCRTYDEYFREVKKEAKRRNDESFTHTTKNFTYLYKAIMPFVYKFDGEDSDWRWQSMRESEESEALQQIYAFLEALPGASEIELICAVCGLKLSGFRRDEIDKFDFYPKALWEQMDLGFGKIVRPLLDNEWRYIK